MLFGAGEIVGGGAGSDWDKNRRYGVGVTGLGGVESLRARKRIEEECAISGSRGTSSGLEVGARVQGAAGIGIRAGELMIWYFWLTSTTLQLATLVSGKINLPVNFCFTSAPKCQLNSPFEVNLSLDWDLGWGGGKASVDRIKAPMSSPMSCFDQPGNGSCHPRGWWGRASFYACIPPSKPCTGASFCKERDNTGWGELYPPEGSASSPCPKGTWRIGAHHTTPAP